MLSITATEDWKKACPGAAIGYLEISNVEQPAHSIELNARKREIEARLREQYSGWTRQDFLALPTLAAYKQYFKRWDKTYHVLLQVESIVLKGKNLPEVTPLVDANFMAEVETMVGTAGHDVAKLQGDLLIDVAREGDRMLMMNGTLKDLPAGDMLMRDAHGVCCTLLYGQDSLSPVTAATCHVLYMIYAPAGVPLAAVTRQLQDMEANVRVFAPQAVLEQRGVISA
ncbi:MAG TPA: hypothetical protein PKW33_20820 [Anaerolineaceae bacterium]|nr:hypothetical protein [Anaerolineaceae bacterium]HPN54052.1 hypothetical protein [Anaerolineaceae bacterium]